MAPERSALVLVDMQHDVVRGRWWTWWPEVGGIVTACVRLVDACHAQGVPVVYTKVEYRADGSDTPGAIASGVAEPTEYLVEGTPGTEIIPELAPTAVDVVTTKNLVSAFTSKPFASRIASLRADTLFVVGLAAEGGVRATVQDAHDQGLHPIVVADACGAFGEASYREHMQERFPALGRVVDLPTALAMLAAPPS